MITEQDINHQKEQVPDKFRCFAAQLVEWDRDISEVAPTLRDEYENASQYPEIEENMDLGIMLGERVYLASGGILESLDGFLKLWSAGEI